MNDTGPPGATTIMRDSTGKVEKQASLFKDADFLHYQVVRSKNRKRTMTLKIERDGTAVILVPEKTPKSEIDRFFRSKIDWITRKLSEYRSTPGAMKAPRLFVPGDRFLYLGEEFPLEMIDGVRKKLVLSKGVFKLCSDHNADPRQLFIDWYKQRAREIFTERVAHYGRQLGLEPSGIRISSARTRYGSCSPDNSLSFSYRLVMAPYSVIDYIIIHELAHIRIKNHSKRFWEYVGKLMPDYKERKLWLTQKGHLLEI